MRVSIRSQRYRWARRGITDRWEGACRWEASTRLCKSTPDGVHLVRDGLHDEEVVVLAWAQNLEGGHGQLRAAL